MIWYCDPQGIATAVKKFERIFFCSIMQAVVFEVNDIFAYLSKKRTVPIEKLLITYNKLPVFFSQQQSRIDYHEHRTEVMPQCSGYRGQNTKG